MSKQLFDDTKDFLQNLKKYSDKLTVIILTTGDEKLQDIKMQLTGMYDLVDEVRITRDRNKIAHIKKITEELKPQKTFFVDDRIHMTPSDFDFPITIFEMDRKYEKTGENVIHNLSEIPLSELID